MNEEQPILFNAPMVRAILDGRKKQTRRVAKLTDGGHVKELRGHRRWHPADPDAIKACPYGAPGDRLWVCETFAFDRFNEPEWVPESRIIWKADRQARWYRDNEWISEPYYLSSKYQPARWSPSIHMPRWASRITLTITDVRVERLQDISQKDAQWESVGLVTVDSWPNPEEMQAALDKGRDGINRREGFRLLWDSINGKKHPWESNPWVWAVSFERATGS